MWTKPQVAAFQRVKAASAKWEPALDRLAEIAKHAPQFADRIKELQTRAENARLLSDSAIAIDPVGK